MTDPQPDVRWAPIPPKPRNSGRIWLIVGLSVLAIAIVAALLFFLIPRGETTVPGATESPSPSASPVETETSAPPTEPETDPTPVETAPPVADPSLDAFRAQVEEWLTSAPTGLDIVSETSGQEALSVLDTLQQDAQRLSEAAAPSSLASEWADGATAYAQRLTELRSAVSSGSGVDGALDSARASLDDLRGIAGA